MRCVPAPMYYSVTGILARLRRDARNYPARVRVDFARPLIEAFAARESLFVHSGDRYESLVEPFRRELHWPVGRLYNCYFEAGDPELYYAILRTHRSRLVVEVGSGHSTLFAMEALRKNGGGRIVCIDPAPLRNPPKGAEHIRARVEEADLRLFAQLQAGDVLFIDSSHTTEEAKYHTEYILPALAAGVLVHHHDFTFPYAIYWRDNPRDFGEPDVLLDFYWNHRRTFEVLVSTSYLRFKEPGRWSRLVPAYRWNPTRTPGSLWTVKAG